jgi:hypothetical protein
VGVDVGAWRRMGIGWDVEEEATRATVGSGAGVGCVDWVASIGTVRRHAVDLEERHGVARRGRGWHMRGLSHFSSVSLIQSMEDNLTSVGPPCS